MKSWFDKTLEIKRDEWTEAPDGTPLTTGKQEKADIKGHIQQASPEFAEAMQMEYRKTFILYTDYNADIKEGDNVIDDDINYTIKGLQRFSHEKVGNPHTKAILQL